MIWIRTPNQILITMRLFINDHGNNAIIHFSKDIKKPCVKSASGSLVHQDLEGAHFPEHFIPMQDHRLIRIVLEEFGLDSVELRLKNASGVFRGQNHAGEGQESLVGIIHMFHVMVTDLVYVDSIQAQDLAPIFTEPYLMRRQSTNQLGMGFSPSLKARPITTSRLTQRKLSLVPP